MMHKKVYNDFARMIRSQRHKALLPYTAENQKIIVKAKCEQIDSILESLVTLFQQDNSQFNTEKFIKACEINVES